MVVELFTTTLPAAVPPKETEAGAAKLVPVIVTALPPALGPDGGEIPVTVGTGSQV
jgi:hypothetical protein